MCTPIQKLNNISNNRIFVKRDDLLGFSFGGNKARIAREFFDDMYKKGADCIIGYGSSRSNLCRAISNISCSEGIPCHIVSPFEDDGTRVESTNDSLVKKCGVKIHYCSKQNVARTVEAVINECKDAGYTPYYINGDKYGCGNERVPLYAYEKAYAEIARQSQEQGIIFDYIFLATGTGMTQSGLILGCEKLGGTEKIVGISVAREAQAELKIIQKFLKSADVQNSAFDRIELTDKYLCGGYGEYTKQVADTIWNVYKNSGIPLDPTYTGKGFYGMLEYLKENKIKDGNILFIHTGGTPLFFDFVRACKSDLEVESCDDGEKLLRYLERIDACLPTPLSARVVLKSFAEKVLCNGKVLAVEEDGEIVSAILFYANDTEKKAAYITLLGSLPECQGKGHADALMKTMEESAKRSGMNKVHLDTDVTNTRAISFYSKKGYIIESADGKIHMVKDI